MTSLPQQDEQRNDASIADIDGSTRMRRRGATACAPGSYFDLDKIRDALPMSDLLEHANVDLKDNRAPCPLHGGINPTSFVVYADDTRFHCNSCGADGDVFEFIRARHQLSFRDAVKVAANLAGIAPGAPPDPSVLAARQAERDRRAAEKAAQAALKRSEAVRVATDDWWDLHHPFWNDSRRRQLWGGYLTTRGLSALTQPDIRIASCVASFVRARYDGAPATPIYSLETIADPFHRNLITGVAWRQVVPGASPKVLVGNGHKTEGTFGESWRLACREPIDRVVLVEGVVDFLTAHLVFETTIVLPIEPLIRGRALILGAHSASRIAQIVARLADEPTVGVRFRSLPLLLVTHVGDVKGAGEKAEAEAFAEARARGMTATRFDLDGKNDLNDWWCALKRTSGGAR